MDARGGLDSKLYETLGVHRSAQDADIKRVSHLVIGRLVRLSMFLSLPLKTDWKLGFPYSEAQFRIMHNVQCNVECVQIHRFNVLQNVA